MSNPSTSISTIQERSRRRILSDVDKIPVLPELVSKVLNLISMPETEPGDLATALEQDPGLVGKMLAFANSPYYGVNQKVTTIKQAIMILGFQGIRSLLLTTGATDLLGGDFSFYGHNEKGLLSHSLAVGQACRILAKRSKMPASLCEELFVAGLLHDIGKMMIAPRLSECRISPQSFPGSIQEMEQKILGLDHTEAGALVAAKWNLGDLIGDCLRHHHQPGEPSENQKPLAVLRVADALAHELGFGYRRGAAPEAIYLAEDLKALDLDEGRWQAAHAELAEEIRAVMDSQNLARA